MVNSGKGQSGISLDPIHHKVGVGAVVVELQPLTFALFSKLLEHRNQVVPAAVLTDEVWGSIAVSPDTLKQRIFLLRKALDEARVEGCFVQSVRGQGYRLVVPDEEGVTGAVAAHRRRGVTLGVLVTLVVAATAFWSLRQPYEPPPNNRVVFWASSAAESPYVDGGKWEQAWMTQLSASEKLIFVAAERDPARSLTAQARLSKAALVSVWTRFEDDGQALVRMQILEPKTASTLRSDLAAMTDDDEMTRLLAAQGAAIERILEADILPLLSEPLNDTDHPAWNRLRKLASDPD